MAGMGDSTSNIESVLAKSGKMGDINAMMAKLQEYMNCDETCKKEREKKKLEIRLQEAENNSRNGPEKVAAAKKALYTLIDGEQGYRDKQLKVYGEEAKNEEEASLGKHAQYMHELNALASSYDADNLYYSRMMELRDNLQKENKQLQIDIDNEIGATQTDGRKMVYETRETDNIIWVRKIFVLIYFLILVVYIFTGNFFEDKLYMKWKTWLYIVLFCIFPFIIDFLSRLLMELYQKLAYLIYNKLPRNVYV